MASQVADPGLREFFDSIPAFRLPPSYPGTEVTSVAGKIEGCLFPGEEVYLAYLAMSCTGEGVIVEIGSYLGRSAVSLGLGSLQGSRTMVFTYDHFLGDPFMEVSPSQFATLQRNIQSSGVASIVIPSNVPSSEAAKSFSDPIELLFVDANHAFEEVENDFNLWSPKVIVGGTVAFHDTFDPVMQGLRFDGPLRVIQKYCKSPEWTIVGRFQSITVVRKNGMPKKQTQAPEKQVMSKSVQKRIAAQKGKKVTKK